MKKILLVVLLFITISLASCDISPVEDNPTCQEGYTQVGETCVPDEEEPNDNPTDTNNPNSTSTICPHLEDIEDYVAVWCDEFDYEGLPDSTKWSYDVGGHGWGNNELQYYTENDLDNASVSEGYLTITAIKETMGSNAYTSTRLVTREKGDWLYGKIQIKAKLPSGKGTWPAIWMLPTDWEYGGWPYSGEIDIMEHVGYEEDKVYSTIHTGAYNHTLGTQIGYEYTDTTLESAFHVYEIEWEPGLIKTYIDGNWYATFSYNPDFSEGIELTDAWPFDEEFHLILNIAVGGSWGGAQGVDTDIWPQEMVVDYVRVYQKDYITGDQENPDQVTNMETSNITSNTAFVKWDQGTDDKKVKEYEIILNDVLLETHSHNAILLYNLLPSTTYKVGVIAIDFAGNKSIVQETTFTTSIPPTISGIIEAEDFVIAQGIDTQATEDTGGGRNVGWTDNNDFLTYTLEVEEAGNYTIDFRVASGTNGGTFRLSDDEGHTVTLTTPATGGWQNWQTITSSQIALTEGIHTFTITFTSQGTNLNYFEFKKVE